MVSFSTFGIGSSEVITGSSNYGLLTLYLFSRRGAAHLLDFSTMRKCYFATLGWYMIGISIGMAAKVNAVS